MASKKKKSKRNPKKKLLFLVIVIAIVFVGAPFVKIEFTQPLRQIIQKILPKTHESLDFSQAKLLGNFTLEFSDFKYNPDPPVNLTAKKLDIRISIIKLLFGELEFLDIYSPHLKVVIPSNIYWRANKPWREKKTELSKRTEWFSLMGSSISCDTLDIQYLKQNFQIIDFTSDQKIDDQTLVSNQSWKGLYSNTIPNLYQASQTIKVNSKSLDIETKTSSALGEVNLKIESTKKHELIKGKILLNSSLEKMGNWLFNPDANLKGELKGEFNFTTQLTQPIDYFSSKFKLKGHHLGLEGLAFQKSATLKQMAPELKKINLSSLNITGRANPKSISFDTLTAVGKQLSIGGSLQADWDGVFRSNFDIILSEKSTSKLSPLAQKSLDKNAKGEAFFPIQISGNPKEHEIDNLGELIAGAVGNNIKSIGESIIGFFQ
jgi:hypothetical protein